ncbi:MAG: agmatine deiminase family protein [Myxococcales bacterium]|nr:agmatine deiminase family protein [Myxococcales bacterium]MCB9716050.1 agmatine deiminase family protein [Myxococcales bacterium]
MRLWAVLYAATYLLTSNAIPPTDRVVWTPTKPERTLVGDWESPSAVVLVYGDEWMDTYELLLDQLTEVVDVTVLVEEGQSLDVVEAGIDALDDAHRARVWTPGHEVDSSWPRDYGPLQTREADGAIAWLDALYSAERPKDDDLPIHLAEWYGAGVEPFEFSIDGGAVASNGAGLCVTTDEYLALADIDAEDEPLVQVMMDRLGCEGLVMVPALAYEDTKHVDLVMQFLSPELVVVARFDPERAPDDAVRANRAARALAAAAEAMGMPLRIERIDSPPPQARQYPSYLNFLQVEGYLLVPSYDMVDESIEQRAMKRLAELVPDRTVVPIPSDDVLPHGGAVHCLTWGMMRG